MMQDDIQAIREIGLEIFEGQNQIIRLQSKAIDELVRLLLQHRDASESDMAKAKAYIDEAAMVRAEMNL